MLSARDARRDSGRRRAEPSQRQRYDEYVLQRIEQFKNSVSREVLTGVANDASQALANGDDEQFVLTEMLMADVVDAAIRKRLRLKSFAKWKQQFAKVRKAQQQPTHWNLDVTCPLVGLIGRVEPGDRSLVIGRGAEACAYLLAAHDADIHFWDAELGVVDRVEQTMRDESLAMHFFSAVTQLERCIPTHGAPYDILVLDAGALADCDASQRPRIVAELQQLTADGGVHVLLSSPRMVPEAIYSFYGGWEREPPLGLRRSQKPQGVVLVKPTPHETEQAERA